MKQTIENVTGWRQHGKVIETPDGIHAEDYFRDGIYIGADADGVEPIFNGEQGASNEI